MRTSSNHYNLFASTIRGCEPVLADELKGLGAENIRPARRGVFFTGTLETLYRTNLWLGTAHRVLLNLSQFPCSSPEELYEGVRKIRWLDHMAPTSTLAVHCSLGISGITHSQYAALKTKDAIVDQIRELRGVRPSVDRFKPECAVHIYIHEDLCTVSLDSSGQSLHKRGYRTAKVHAPLQESLAFGILSYTRWNRTECICDLMCGSGTLAIEAALMASGRAPGLNRSYFSFKYWPGFNKRLWKELTEQARVSVRKTHVPPVFAYDVSAEAVQAARINSRVAGVDKIITFKKQNIRDFRNPMPGKGGILLCNPPYGLRQGAPGGTSALYPAIGDVFKREGQGCTGYIFTGNPALSKKVGLRTKRRITLYNGDLECRLLEYELYAGTRKQGRVKTLGMEVG